MKDTSTFHQATSQPPQHPRREKLKTFPHIFKPSHYSPRTLISTFLCHISLFVLSLIAPSYHLFTQLTHEIAHHPNHLLSEASDFLLGPLKPHRPSSGFPITTHRRRSFLEKLQNTGSDCAKAYCLFLYPDISFSPLALFSFHFAML